MRYASRYMVSTALALLASAAAATPVNAQTHSEDGSTVLEDVVVTARRKDERLQSVPVAVTAVTSNVMREQNIAKFEDLQRIVPGFMSGNSARGGSSATYTIRGQRGALTQTSLVDPAVSVYFAEYNLSRPTGTNQSMFDLQSVEILKGPQGTLFGRNSTGGAVLITPQAPSEQFEGYAQVSMGNYRYRDFEGAVNVPLGDKVSIRAGAKISDRQGYLKNTLNGLRADDLDAQSYRLSVRVRPNDQIDSTTIATYFESGGYGTDVKLYLIEPRFFLASATLPPAAKTLLISKLQQELAATPLNGWTFRNVNPQTNFDRVKSIQNSTSIDVGDMPLLGKVTIKNIIGYRDIVNRHNNSFVGAGVDLFRYPRGRIAGNSWSEEFQVQGVAGKLDYIVGAYYFTEKGHDDYVSSTMQYLTTPEVLSTLSPADVTRFLTSFPSTTINDFNTKNTSYAAFFHGNYNLSSIVEGLSLSAGIRYTKDKRAVVYHNVRSTGVAPTSYTCTVTSVVTPTPPDRTICAVPARASYSEPSYDVSLNYQVTPDVLVYGAHRHGYRAGGFNSQPPPVPPFADADRSFGPELVDDVELGLKSDFSVGGMAGRLNLAAYHQWYSDIQRNRVIRVGNAINTILANVAKAHSDGAEAELTLRPTDSIEISANYAYIRARYDEYISPNPDLDVSDSTFLGIPTHQYSVSVSYTLPTPESVGRITLRGTLSGVSKFSVADPNTHNCGLTGTDLRCLSRLADLPGYATLDFRADWRRLLDTNADLALFVRNVTNEFHYTFTSSSTAQTGFAAASVNAPRMWGLELRVPFGATADR